jgi:hypothetical protein
MSAVKPTLTISTHSPNVSYANSAFQTNRSSKTSEGPSTFSKVAASVGTVISNLASNAVPYLAPGVDISAMQNQAQYMLERQAELQFFAMKVNMETNFLKTDHDAKMSITRNLKSG